MLKSCSVHLMCYYYNNNFVPDWVMVHYVLSWPVTWLKAVPDPKTLRLSQFLICKLSGTFKIFSYLVRKYDFIRIPLSSAACLICTFPLLIVCRKSDSRGLDFSDYWVIIVDVVNVTMFLMSLYLQFLRLDNFLCFSNH